jgi:hypothetical protein
MRTIAPRASAFLSPEQVTFSEILDIGRSTEVRSGPIDEPRVEDALIATVMNAVGPR